jgi:cytoskeletal protein RodZ
LRHLPKSESRAGESAPEFGARMKKLREQRGVPLRDIAERTKISVSVLEALERNDISRLPGGIFSRGFVRAYAEQIGADPEAAVKEFIARFPDDRITNGSPYVAAEEIDTDPPSQVGRGIVLTLAVLLPVAAIIIWSIVAGN